MGPTEKITAAHRQRFETMQELGCVICSVYFRRPGTPGQVHHLLSGGRRIGHDATIYLHPWFHAGEPPTSRIGGRVRQLTIAEATRIYGPSLAHDRPSFEARFGTEQALLEMQNDLIAAYERCTRGAA